MSSWKRDRKGKSEMVQVLVTQAEQTYGKFFERTVLALVDLAMNRAKVHRPLDDVRISGDLCGIDGLEEEAVYISSVSLVIVIVSPHIEHVHTSLRA
jgi:hypothetical protein